MENTAASNGPPKGIMHSEKLKLFFIDHLNRIYCAKSHLQKSLPEIRVHVYFRDLAHAVTETLVDVEKQISRMDYIYELPEIKPGYASCQGVLGLIEDTFNAISQKNSEPEMRDLSILFYLQNIEAIEMASYKMLNLTAPRLEKRESKQLLKENLGAH